MKPQNINRLIVGDIIEFTNLLGLTIKETIVRTTDKSVFYKNGSRESWNTFNYCIKKYNAKITRIRKGVDHDSN